MKPLPDDYRYKLLISGDALRALAMFIAMIALTWGSAAVQAAGPDIVLADFEGKDYGDWKTTGEAFGPGPAQGTLPHQMPVSGYLGHGLANSFYGGDKSIGTLTSPEFTINRKFIHFLIGGGGFAGKTCMNLLVDGKAVRTAVGPNTAPGGSEELGPASWDVSDLVGKTAQIQIVDNATGGWGHINVDQIVLSDQQAAAPPKTGMRERVLTIEKRYLHFPVKNDTKKGKKQRVSVLVDGEIVREFEMALTDQPDWYAHLDVSAWRGKKATVRVEKFVGRLEGPAAWSRKPTPFGARPSFIGNRCGRSSTSRRAGAGTTTPTDWSSPRRVSPVLPAQPLRLGLGQHALGPRRQPRPGALGRTAHRDLSAHVRRLGLLRQRGRGQGQHLRLEDRH